MTSDIINQIIERAANALITAKALDIPSSASNELCHTLLTLQDELFTLKSYLYALRSGSFAALEHIQKLENDIEQLKQHKHPIEQYEGCQLPAGPFVYQLRGMQDTHAPYGYFCPRCMHQRGASALTVISFRKHIYLECQTCARRFTYKKL